MQNETYTIIRNAFSRAIPADQTRQETTACYSAQVRDEILELCKTKKYTPVVARYLIDLGIETDFWQAKYDEFLERNRRILDFVSRLFDLLAEKGITSPVVYENFGALLESGTDIALYASGDVDLCANMAEYAAIAGTMEALGFTESQGDVRFYHTFRTGFGGKIGDMDYRINVMFTPLVRYKLPIRISNTILTPEDFRFYENTKIRIPTTEMLLYLNLLRISAHGYVRSPDIRLYVDIYNATVRDPDWQKILAWAKSDGTTIRVAVAAGIAHHMLGTHVPDAVLSLLNSKMAGALMDVVYDSKRKMLKLHPSRLDRFRTEFYSDGHGMIRGILSMLFPDRKWLREYYAVGKEPLLKSYIRYLGYLVKGRI